MQSKKHNKQVEIKRKCSVYLPGSPIAFNLVPLLRGTGAHIPVQGGEASATLVIEPDPGQCHKGTQQVQPYGIPLRR